MRTAPLKVRLALSGLVGLALAGCTMLGYRSRSQTSKECARAGAGADHRSMREAACMVATGEPTFVLVPVSPVALIRMSFTVQARSAKTTDTALADLLACDGPTTAVQAAVVDDGTPRRRSATREWKVERAFADCMSPRGYTVHRWQSTTKD
jgi:hypothetical protein